VCYKNSTNVVTKSCACLDSDDWDTMVLEAGLPYRICSQCVEKDIDGKKFVQFSTWKEGVNAFTNNIAERKQRKTKAEKMELRYTYNIGGIAHGPRGRGCLLELFFIFIKSPCEHSGVSLRLWGEAARLLSENTTITDLTVNNSKIQHEVQKEIKNI